MGERLALIANGMLLGHYNQNRCKTGWGVHDKQNLFTLLNRNPEIDPNISESLIYVNSSISIQWDKWC